MRHQGQPGAKHPNHWLQITNFRRHIQNQQSNQAVITSYSIHYTKLYEIQDAEKNKAADGERKAMVDLRNQADALVAQTEKSLSENGDKVSAEDKAAIEAAASELTELLKDSNATKAQIEEKVKKLTDASHKMAEQMYKQQEGGQAASGEKKKDDDVIDAEIE